jgi:hypothetical protein
MLSCHELIGFMSPALALEIVEFAFASDKPTYRAVLAAVAEVHRVRPAFLEKKPRKERHQDMLATLARPRLEEATANLLRAWLVKSQTQMLADFLDGLGITHDKGVVEDFPPSVEDTKLTSAVENLLAKYPHERVAVYLNAIFSTGVRDWKNLEAMLKNEKRLQLG